MALICPGRKNNPCKSPQINDDDEGPSLEPSNCQSPKTRSPNGSCLKTSSILSVLYTNIDSISNKTEEYTHLIDNENPDIIVTTDVNPKNATYKLTDNEMKINNYAIFSNLDNDNIRGVTLQNKN